jgi:ankyrin repeat protein
VEFQHPISLARPLHRACLGGALDVVKFLVDEKKVMVNCLDDEEWRPLHFAASKGFVDICVFLMDHGAEIDARDNAGNTALHLAAGRGQEEVVELLLSRGASCNIYNSQNKVAGELAASRRIARAIAGLQGDAPDDFKEEDFLPAVASDTSQKDGEFFDATKLYDLEFSSESEVQ